MCTWGNVDAARKHVHKRPQAVLVEGVDLAEAVEQEEDACAPVGHLAVLVARLVDGRLHLTGLLHLGEKGAPNMWVYGL